MSSENSEYNNDTKSDLGDIEDFDKLLNMVRVDSSLVDGLTESQVTTLRKRMNPYGRTIQGKGKFTCLSIMNISENYMRKYLMTSLIGFLYRRCDEHGLSDGEPTTPMDDFSIFMEKYNSAVSDALKSKRWLADFEHDKKYTCDDDLTIEEKSERLDNIRAVKRGEGFKKRLVVRKFLDELFQFNPDLHVRSAYSHNPLDPERVVPSNVDIGGVKKELKSEEDVCRSNSKFTKHIPPADTFHRWKYYTDSNYEELRTAVQDLYCEKPDIEFAINPYEQFNNEEDAAKFVQKHKSEVIADVLTLHNSKWNLIGSFKNNRERINFYNERTEVLEAMAKQEESDKKLGADLMRKRAQRKKKENVEESGPDPEALIDYKKNNPSAFESMGAEDVNKNGEMSNKEESSFKIHEECPYDAVQVDVFDFRKGGQVVNKSEFFSKASDPEPLGTGTH